LCWRVSSRLLLENGTSEIRLVTVKLAIF
jgi:hypothetical protein